MRKNTEEALKAFADGRNWKGPRDEIKIGYNNNIVWYLHGNPIAQRDGSFLHFSTCGWNTVTTWDRLWAISVHYGVRDYCVRKESMKYNPTHLQVWTARI